ncbi:hypothetical protein RA25_13840 [Leisingera sp. ANG-S5]|nr:hypothetical protein RA25_13840 [Leisingera sp. ANG-S5]
MFSKRGDRRCGKFAAWLQADADRLAAAAELLGGESWKNRALVVAEAIARGEGLEEVEADLAALRRLLTLEFTGEIDSFEAVRFLSVHPDDPRADDARLCAEALDRGLDAMRIYAETGIKEVA